MAQAVGVKVICPRQRTPAVAYSVMTQEIQASIQGHPVATPPLVIQSPWPCPTWSMSFSSVVVLGRSWL